MLGGELIFHFVNVMLLTVVIAPLILWRYRRAVLAGMQDRGGARCRWHRSRRPPPSAARPPRQTLRPPALAWKRACAGASSSPCSRRSRHRRCSSLRRRSLSATSR
jgi:hypothetical protein